MNKGLIEHALAEVISKGLGLDLNDPNLIDTPDRIAKMWVNEFFVNVGKEFEDFKTFPNDRDYDEIILSDKIYFVSMCSHHFLPFSGYAWVMYIPKNLLIGASKMARVVNHYSARPQLQENLCQDIINAFRRGLEPKGVMVVMRGLHGCMGCRGVRQAQSGMTTSAVWGCFKENPSTKQEGMDLIKLSVEL